MTFGWNRNLELGISQIDEQHRELFRRLDLLIDAMMKREGSEALASLFDFLGTYVYEHFTAEESLMRAHAYPQLAEHEAEHKRFVEDFMALQREYAKEGPTALLLVRVNGRVGQWLVEHIARTDKAVGNFLRQRALV